MRIRRVILGASLLKLIVGGALLLITAGKGHAQSVPVTYIESSMVASAFAKGAPLVEVAGYKIHASRREAPGMAEIHVRDTDILYVLEGTATMVTGGSVPDAGVTAPDELRGSAIVGGDVRVLRKGDVFIVPNGTPHWFREVDGPFLYYVVKVDQGGHR